MRHVVRRGQRRRRCRRRLTRRGRGRSQTSDLSRQFDGKDAAFAFLALDGQRAAYELHQGARNGQAQTCAAELAGDAAVGLPKRFEDGFQFILWNADAGVCNGNEHSAIRSLRGGHPQRDTAFACELDGVAGEVDQHLAQFLIVSLDHQL